MSGCIFPDCKETCLPSVECLHDLDNRLEEKDKTVTNLINENRQLLSKVKRLEEKVNNLQNKLANKSNKVVKREPRF